jgi:CheY-like chemotaxis protein
MNTKTILLIDDDDEFRHTAIQVLVDAGHDVWDARCPDEAFPLLARERFDIIVCDLHMPFTLGESLPEYGYSFEVGLRTVKEFRWVYPNLPILAISVAAPEDLRRIAKYLDPIPAFTKPFYPEELVSLIERHCDPSVESISQ